MSTQLTVSAATLPLDTFKQRVQLTAASHDVAAQKPIGDLVDAFLDAAAGRSTATKRSYLKGVADFLDFLHREKGALLPDAWQPIVTTARDGRRIVYAWNEQTPAAVLWTVDAALLDAYALHVGADSSPSTTEQRVNVVRTFLRVALRDNVLTHEQGQQLGLKPYQQRRQRTQTTVGRRLSVEEVRALRRSVDSSSTRGKRDAALLDCMLFAGLRRAEVANLRTGDVQLDQGRYWLNLTGKGRKQRKLKMHDSLYKSLHGWIEEAGIDSSADVPLFPSVDRWGNVKDSTIDPNVIERVTAEYAAVADIAPAKGKRKLAPHDLRRTCARNAYDNGATLLQVQQMLGHSDPKTTARYIGLDQETDNTAVDCVRY